MIKIGKTNRPGSAKKYAYADLEYDICGWADASKYLPADFDLCYAKTAEGKTKSGWTRGAYWDGFKIDPYEKVLYWKRQPEP